ncbi:MAG TPA: DUF58 domain-containing protein [Acidimicrobiia bacterium]|nr:DUF58 domain-containing protein [Acidimicrobiia bacterium]
MRPTARILTRRGWSLAGAALGLAVAGRLLGTVELWTLTTGIALLLVTSTVWARTRRFDLVARREIRPARLYVGGDGRVDLTLSNHSRRTTPLLTVTDVFDDGHRAARFVLRSLPAGEAAKAAYRLPTNRRGRFHIGPLAVSVSDPFGLVRRTWTLTTLGDVLVRPRVHDILAPRQAGGRLVASVETVHARAQAADGEDFLTLREYEVGDDLRRVHWRSTARVGDLMIRQDEAQWRARAVVLLDTRPAAHDGRSFETAVEATASIVDRLTRMRRRVEVIASNGQSLGAPTARSGWEGMDRLATIQPGGDDRLAGLLTSLRAHRRAAFVVAIVGSLDHVELDALGALTAHGTVVMVATRPGSQSPPALLTWSGLVVVDASRTPFPTAWNQAMTRWHLAPPPRSPRSRLPR